MFIFGEILGLVVVLLAGVAWMRADEREAHRYEHALARDRAKANAGGGS
jgi:hypothetical protein